MKTDDLPTLFFLQLRKNDVLNKINIIRLKDKLGTRQLPTAELILEGTEAEIASPRGKGIAYIMQLANITRLHNMISSVGYMRGMLSLLEDYSNKRKVFGKLMMEQELHYSTFRNLQCLFEGNLLLSLYVAKLMGEDYKNFHESKNISDKNIKIIENNKNDLEQLLRMLLAIGKIYCGRNSELLCLEAIQCFGALGYMENSGIPMLLRDTMVTAIWEGTFNTLSLEFFKLINKEKNRNILVEFIRKNINLGKLKDKIKSDFEKIIEFILKVDLMNIVFYKKEFCSLVSTAVCSSLIINFNNDEENEFLIYFWVNRVEIEMLYFRRITETNSILIDEMRNKTKF